MKNNIVCVGSVVEIPQTVLNSLIIKFTNIYIYIYI